MVAIGISDTETAPRHQRTPARFSRGAFDRAVRDTIESDPPLSHALLPMRQARQVLFDTFLELDRRVRRAAKEDPICRRFMGVPGVGEITALSFKERAIETERNTHGSAGGWLP